MKKKKYSEMTSNKYSKEKLEFYHDLGLYLIGLGAIGFIFLDWIGIGLIVVGVFFLVFYYVKKRKV